MSLGVMSRHVADALAHAFGILTHVDAVHPSVAGSKRQQAGEHLDDGGFSAAVGPQKTEDFALFHAQVHAIDGDDLAKPPHQALRKNRQAVGRRCCCFGFLRCDFHFCILLCAAGLTYFCSMPSFTSAAMPAITFPLGSLMRSFTPNI